MNVGEINRRLENCQAAARILRTSSAEPRNRVLLTIEKKLKENQSTILQANQTDLKALPPEATPAFRDRLVFNENRILDALASLRQVAAEPSPVGETVESRTLANGLLLKRVRAPLGIIFMIFESRPNVALEAFSLALKSGNVILLRGGKESASTTQAIYEVIQEALQAEGFTGDYFWGITDPDRALVGHLLKQKKYIDVVVPRGGEGLINFVVENSLIPIIKNDRGMCHLFVHKDASLEMALSLIENAKTQRPGVCNAMETVLVHRDLKDNFIPALYARLAPKGVEWFGCAETVSLLPGKPQVKLATEENFSTEYLDLKMNCKVVSSLEEAILHIERFGSRHSESIITQNESAARKFQNEIDAAAVYWNASTRFTDGFAFGLGGELGISTQKLHVRGPVGLKELTSLRWIIDGNGQTR